MVVEEGKDGGMGAEKGVCVGKREGGDRESKGGHRESKGGRNGVGGKSLDGNGEGW